MQEAPNKTPHKAMQKLPAEKKKENGFFMPPLFDRLTTSGLSLLTEEEVTLSLQRELTHLFNTRVVFQKVTPLEEHTRETAETFYTLPNYFGVLDFADLSTEGETASELLEMQLQKACLAYEPRLKNPRVKLEQETEGLQKIVFSLSGHLVLGDKITHITFPLSLDLAAPQGW